jgi:hypothetical protein
MFWLKSKIFFLPTYRWQHISHIFQPWKRRQYITPKRHGTNWLHDVITQKIGTFHIHIPQFQQDRICQLQIPRPLCNFRATESVIASDSELTWARVWFVLVLSLTQKLRHFLYVAATTLHMQQTNDELEDETYRGTVPTGRRVTCTWCVLFLSSSSLHDIIKVKSLCLTS